jgi:hypothetical protein
MGASGSGLDALMHHIERVTGFYPFLNPFDSFPKVRQSKPAVNLSFFLAPFGVSSAEGFHVFIVKQTEPTPQTLHTFAVVRIGFQEIAYLARAIGKENALGCAHAYALSPRIVGQFGSKP